MAYYTKAVLLTCLLLCQSVNSLILHPRLRSYASTVAASTSSSSAAAEERQERRHQQQQQIRTVSELSVEQQQQQQKEEDTTGGNNSENKRSGSRMRWYGAEAKEMLRRLDEIRLPKEAASQQQKRKSDDGQVREASLFDKLIALFTDKPDDEGPKHDCFFSAFNCPVNPSRNIPGVRRVRITAEERRKLLAANQRRATATAGTGVRHPRRARHRHPKF